MTAASIDKDVLLLIGKYCPPKAVTALVRDLKRVGLFERKLAGSRKGALPADGSATLMAGREKLDLLITFCKTTLGQEDALQALLEIGDLLKLHGMLQRAEEIYSLVLNDGSASDEEALVAEAYMRRGDVYSRQGRWKDSNKDLDQSRLIFRRLKENESVGRVENILGTSYAEQGKLKQAATLFGQALTAFEKSENTTMTGAVLINLGIVNNIIGQHDIALTYFKRAQSHFEEVGDLNRLAELHHNMGMSFLSKGSLNDAVHEFDAGAGISLQAGNVNLQGLAGLGKAHAHFRMHDLSMALKLVNGAIDLFTKCNDRLSVADGYKVKGMIFRELHRLDFAEFYLATSLRINEELNNRLNAAETYFEMGLLERTRGNKKKMRAAFENAHRCFVKVGALADAERTRREISNERSGKHEPR